MSKFSVILVLMFSYPFILFMMRIQELRELRGIVIKLFYHTLALLHFTFLFHILHIPADTRSAFPVISVQSPVSIQCCWQS